MSVRRNPFRSARRCLNRCRDREYQRNTIHPPLPCGLVEACRLVEEILRIDRRLARMDAEMNRKFPSLDRDPRLERELAVALEKIYGPSSPA